MIHNSLPHFSPFTYPLSKTPFFPFRKMGSNAYDHHEDYDTKQLSLIPRAIQHTLMLKLIVFVICTNFLSIYLFTGPFNLTSSPTNKQLITDPWDVHVASLLQQLNSTKSQISELDQKLTSSNLLVQALLIEMTTRQRHKTTSKGKDLPLKLDYGRLENRVSDEVKLAIGPHKLPVRYSTGIKSEEMLLPVGAACLRFKEEMAKYMTYNVGEECPEDGVAERLMLIGCEPLPRRRCHPKVPANYSEPLSFPQCLWTTPPENNIIWDSYNCKSYKCLIDSSEKEPAVSYGCKSCFNLQGDEKSRWIFDNGGLDFGIEDVLRGRPQGTIRIGLDISGGSGTFAARMKERDITIITSTTDLEGPFSSFIAWRGLIPIQISVNQRLPFFDSSLDIVHSKHVLGHWIPDAMLEFTLYDIHRILRPGGIFWLDHFICLGPQLNQTYIPMLGGVGFRKLRWYASMIDIDGEVHRTQWFFSAVFEKPMT